MSTEQKGTQLHTYGRIGSGCRLGRFENNKNPNINLVQMGSNGTHKNKTHLEKEKILKVNICIGKCILKKIGRPLKVKKNGKKSGFMIVKISALVHRYQCKKLEFNSSYG